MKQKHLDAPLIIRSIPTEHDFFDYHHEERFAEIRSKMRTREYTVGKTKVAYRVISHWDNNKILPEGLKNVSGDWRKFSLIEIVWIEVVKRLRTFGFSLEKIATVREYTMRWNKTLDSYPDLEYFVVKAQSSAMNPYIMVLSNGYADVGSLADIELSKASLRYNDLLLISIKGILEGRGETVKDPKPLIELSSEEIALFSRVRDGASDEVKAKIKNGTITEIESSYVDTHPARFREIRTKTKKEGMYGSITEQFEKGVQKSVRVTKRRRFS